MKAKGHIVELPFQDETTLKRWILGNVKREGKQMSEASAGYFFRQGRNRYAEYPGRTGKAVLLYAAPGCDHSRRTLTQSVSIRLEIIFFEMVNAVAEKKQRRALDLYYELLALKEPPMRILFFAGETVPDLVSCAVAAGEGIRKKRNCGKGRTSPVCSRKVYGADKVF